MAFIGFPTSNGILFNTFKFFFLQALNTIPMSFDLSIAF
jgi:hypothetical protein